jgi:hypothetical protein
MNIRLAGRCAMWAVLAGGLWLGCGDSAGSDGGDGDGTKKECLSPGAIAMCVCESGVQGTYSCQEDSTWSECTCRPPLDPNMCIEGDKFRCPPCAGEMEGKIVVCQPGGTLSCACEDDGGMTDGMIPEPFDGGQDAGHDAAASGSDAG